MKLGYKMTGFLDVISDLSHWMELAAMSWDNPVRSPRAEKLRGSLAMRNWAAQSSSLWGTETHQPLRE